MYVIRFIYIYRNTSRWINPYTHKQIHAYIGTSDSSFLTMKDLISPSTLPPGLPPTYICIEIYVIHICVCINVNKWIFFSVYMYMPMYVCEYMYKSIKDLISPSILPPGLPPTYKYMYTNLCNAYMCIYKCK
jgi:hypothetical protein